MKKISLLLLIVCFIAIDMIPCTRVVYKGDKGFIATARSMDWEDEIYSDVWCFPRGLKRDGSVGGNSLKWTSKYGSVVTTAFETVTSDGMNEKGLVASLLWLEEAVQPRRDVKIPGVSISAWVQYVLDNFATVDETVKALEKEDVQIVDLFLPEGVSATLHLAISDASGDNAIFEYIDGKLIIHHDPSYVVMTNSPTFDKQLALNEYWKEIGGSVMLPGTERAADRFVRASHYTNSIPKTGDGLLGVATALSVIRNCSVPLGVVTPGQPNVASTLWRTVCDHRDKVYYFESAFSPNLFWISLKDVNLNEGAPVLKLSMVNGEIYSGDALSEMKKAEPFEFYKAL